MRIITKLKRFPHKFTSDVDRISNPKIVFDIEFLFMEHCIGQHEDEEYCNAGGKPLHPGESTPVGPSSHRDPNVIIRELVPIPGNMQQNI